jgi:hypothetical protein
MPWELSLHSITANASNGLSAKVGLLAGSDCGVSSLSGTFKMTRVWAQSGDASAELFEGEVSVKIGYAGMYSRRGHGRGTDKTLRFAAVRAKRDAASTELGLGPRKCQGGSLSHGSGGGGGYGYGSFGFSDVGFSDDESDGEDSDGNVKGSLRRHYRRHKLGIYDY